MVQKTHDESEQSAGYTAVASKVCIDDDGDDQLGGSWETLPGGLVGYNGSLSNNLCMIV